MQNDVCNKFSKEYSLALGLFIGRPSDLKDSELKYQFINVTIRLVNSWTT